MVSSGYTCASPTLFLAWTCICAQLSAHTSTRTWEPTHLSFTLTYGFLLQAAALYSGLSGHRNVPVQSAREFMPWKQISQPSVLGCKSDVPSSSLKSPKGLSPVAHADNLPAHLPPSSLRPDEVLAPKDSLEPVLNPRFLHPICVTPLCRGTECCAGQTFGLIASPLSCRTLHPSLGI